MASISVAGDTSGSVTLSAPAVAGSTVLTLPSVSGTVLTSASSQVNGPAFSVYTSANQPFSAATFTKVQFNTKVFDTNTNFDAATNYRFTPTVTGYYQFSLGLNMLTGSAVNATFIAIAKNGSQILVSGYTYPIGTGTLIAGGLLYMNGSTDFVEAYVYQGGMTQTIFGNRVDLTYFQGAMIRSA